MAEKAVEGIAVLEAHLGGGLQPLPHCPIQVSARGGEQGEGSEGVGWEIGDTGEWFS